MNYLFLDSPLGRLGAVEENGSLCELFFGERKMDFPASHSPLLEELRRELQEYFQGRRRKFDIPLHPKGTYFQRLTWGELCRIPYGETISYGELARRIGRPSSSRAVGGANHRNPIPILIPCHRVVGANGSLTGYGGGLDKKRFLLELEGVSLFGKTAAEEKEGL